MPPLSRSETQTRNRQQVLGAARDAFLRDGYAATSLVSVAAEAGFSTGVVYSNFSGKADLAMQVLRDIQAEQLTALTKALSTSDVEAKLVAVQSWAEDALSSGWPRLELDFALAHIGDADLVEAEGRRYDGIVQRIAEEVAPLLPASVRTEATTRAAAAAVMNMAIGAAVRRIVDPQAAVLEIFDLLRTWGSARS